MSSSKGLIRARDIARRRLDMAQVALLRAQGTAAIASLQCGKLEQERQKQLCAQSTSGSSRWWQAWHMRDAAAQVARREAEAQQALAHDALVDLLTRCKALDQLIAARELAARKLAEKRDFARMDDLLARPG